MEGGLAICSWPPYKPPRMPGLWNRRGLVGPLFANHRVFVHCDNICAVATLNKGMSHNPIVMASLLRIFWLSAIYNFRLKAVYYPGSHDIVADRISRLHEPNGYYNLLSGNYAPHLYNHMIWSPLSKQLSLTIPPPPPPLPLVAGQAPSANEQALDQDVASFIDLHCAPSTRSAYATHRRSLPCLLSSNGLLTCPCIVLHYVPLYSCPGPHNVISQCESIPQYCKDPAFRMGPR